MVLAPSRAMAYRSPSPARPWSRQSAPQHLLQHYRVVVLAVVGGVDERERPGFRSSPQRRKPRPLAAKLVDIAAAELCETCRLVSEPLSEAGAGRQVLLPLVELRLLLRDAAR